MPLQYRRETRWPKQLPNDFITTFSQLHSHQGTVFESDTNQELCIRNNMKKTHTTPSIHKGMQGPRDLTGHSWKCSRKNWKDYVSSQVYFYKCTPHDSTKFTPYQLMCYGRPLLLAWLLPDLNTKLNNCIRENSL